MRDGCAHGDDRAHILVRAFGRFAHRIRNSIGFADSDTDLAVVITGNDRNTELETASTFNNFGNTGDFDYTLVKMLF